MTKLYALAIFLATLSGVIAQDINATTEDGRKVILRPDGTWIFVPTEEKGNVRGMIGTWYSPKGGSVTAGLFELPPNALSLLEKSGLTQATIPLYFTIVNKSTEDIKLNAFTTNITVISKNGLQYSFVNILSDFNTQRKIEELPTNVKRLFFIGDATIYSGAGKVVIIFFPLRIPPPEQWRSVVWDESFGEKIVMDQPIDKFP